MHSKTASSPKEILHVLTYRRPLCQALPGELPIMEPVDGTNCERCAELQKLHDAKYDTWLRETQEGRERIEAAKQKPPRKR